MSKIESAAEELLSAFQASVPLQRVALPKGRQQQESQVAAGLERFYANAKDIRQRHRLGIIGRARVLRAFQGKLIAAGYAPDLVSKVVFALLLSSFVGKAG